MIEYIISSDETDPDSEKPIYDVHLWSLDIDVIGNVYQCKIQGTLNGSTAVSDAFEVEFSPCSQEGCILNYWDDQPQDDSSWNEPESIEFTVFEVSDYLTFKHDTWKDWLSHYCYPDYVDLCG